MNLLDWIEEHFKLIILLALGFCAAGFMLRYVSVSNLMCGTGVIVFFDQDWPECFIAFR